jgi:hypothetical protein
VAANARLAIGHGRRPHLHALASSSYSAGHHNDPSVTEPSKIIPYYCLSWSTWPLSNNKKLLCRLCRVMPDESLTKDRWYAQSPHEGGTRVQVQHYTKEFTKLRYYKPGFIHKSKGDQSLNSGNKLAEDTHGRPSIEYHSSSPCSHSSSQPSRKTPGQIGFPENNKRSKTEYNTQQDWPVKIKTRVTCKASWLVGLFCQKHLRVDPYFQVLAQVLVC